MSLNLAKIYRPGKISNFNYVLQRATMSLLPGRGDERGSSSGRKPDSVNNGETNENSDDV